MRDLIRDSNYEGGPLVVNMTNGMEDGSSITGNYSALAQRSEFENGQGEHGVTCFTCVNVSNNHVCNQYAIDRPCAQGNNFCHTLHIMDPDGGTVMVNKKCANETECAPHSIGCYVIDNQKICIACCDENYCNKAVPNKRANAVFRNSKTTRDKLSNAHNDRVAKNKKLHNHSAQVAYSVLITTLCHSVVLLYYNTLLGSMRSYYNLL